jgi:hypothetical protein
VFGLAFNASESQQEWNEVGHLELGRFGAYDLYDPARKLLLSFYGDYYDENDEYVTWGSILLHNVSSGEQRVLNLSDAEEAGTAPRRRSWGHPVWFDEGHSKVLLTHGSVSTYHSVSGVNDSWVFDIDSLSFSRLNTSGDVPAVHAGFSIASFEGKVYTIFRDVGYILGMADPAVIHSNELFVLDAGDLRWSRIPPSSHFWPTPRAYSASTMLGDRWFFFGGATFLPYGALQFHNDVFFFSMRTQRFERVNALGNSMLPMWSASLVPSASRKGLFLYGGCNQDGFFGDLHELLIDRAVRAGSCEATGAGLQRATAGQPAYFAIQARERLDAPGLTNATADESNGTCRDSSQRAPPNATNWGAPLLWGGGLSFAVTAVGDGDCSVYMGDVEDLGGGLYNVTYTVDRSASAEVLLWVSLDQDCGMGVPDSPFRVALTAGPAVATKSTAGFSFGAHEPRLVAGEKAQVMVTLADEFGNAVRRGGEPSRITVLINFAAPKAMRVMDLGNGSYVASFRVPNEDAPLVTLHILLDGEDIQGSPFVAQLLQPTRVSDTQQAAVWALSCSLVLYLLTLTAIVVRNAAQPHVKAASPRLLLALLFGGVIKALSIAVPPSHPTVLLCNAEEWLAALGDTAMLLVVALTTWRLARIFSPHLRKGVSILDSQLFKRMALGLCLRLLVLSLGTALDPLRVEERPMSEEGVAHCSVRSSFSPWTFLSVAFSEGLIVVCLFYALKTRSIPRLYNKSADIVLMVYSVTLSTLMLFAVNALGNEYDISVRHAVSASVHAWNILTISGVIVANKLLRSGRVQGIRIKSLSGTQKVSVRESVSPDSPRINAVDVSTLMAAQARISCTFSRSGTCDGVIPEAGH